MRKLLTALAIAIVFGAAPARTQEKSTPNNDRAMERAASIGNELAAAFNKKDSQGVAALYASDGVFVGSDGNAAKGRAAIQAAEAKIIKAWGDYRLSVVTKDAGTIDNAVWAIAELAVEIKSADGPITIRMHVLNIFEPEGDNWKVAVTSVGTNFPPQRVIPR